MGILSLREAGWYVPEGRLIECLTECFGRMNYETKGPCDGAVRCAACRLPAPAGPGRGSQRPGEGTKVMD